MTNAGDISCQQECVLWIYFAGNEVEFGDEGMLYPIRQKLCHPDNSEHTKVVRGHSPIHTTLTKVQHEHQRQEERQLKAFANVRCSDLEQVRPVVFLENCGFDFGKISGYQ